MVVAYVSYIIIHDIHTYDSRVMIFLTMRKKGNDCKSLEDKFSYKKIFLSHLFYNTYYNEFLE